MFLELPSSSAIHWQLVTVDDMKRKKTFNVWQFDRHYLYIHAG